LLPTAHCPLPTPTAHWFAWESGSWAGGFANWPDSIAVKFWGKDALRVCAPQRLGARLIACVKPLLFYNAGTPTSLFSEMAKISEPTHETEVV